MDIIRKPDISVVAWRPAAVSAVFGEAPPPSLSVPFEPDASNPAELTERVKSAGLPHRRRN